MAKSKVGLKYDMPTFVRSNSGGFSPFKCPNGDCEILRTTYIMDPDARVIIKCALMIHKRDPVCQDDNCGFSHVHT